MAKRQTAKQGDGAARTVPARDRCSSLVAGQALRMWYCGGLKAKRVKYQYTGYKYVHYLEFHPKKGWFPQKMIAEKFISSVEFKQQDFVGGDE